MVLMGSMTLGQAGPCMEALAAARGVAHTVFNIIDRVCSMYILFCEKHFRKFGTDRVVQCD